MLDYRTIYRTDDGHLRVPFASLGTFLKVEGARVSVAERRAIENVATFAFSVGILSRRLKEYIDAYREESWVDVPVYHLFLDTQSFFLFVQQFLEDLALIIRMFLPHKQRDQMPPAFSHLMPRLCNCVSSTSKALVRFCQFWHAERTWFDEVKDLRDDILHRTAFGKKRLAEFPDLIDVLRAGGGQQPFIRKADLRTYVGCVLVRIFALACLADEFVRITITARHPDAQMPLRGGILLTPGESNLSANELVAQFGLGTPLLSMDAELRSALEFFMEAGEACDARGN